MKKQLIEAALMAVIAGNANAEQGEKSIVPLIIFDQCELQIDKKGYQPCTIRFSDGNKDRYWKKNGKVYWEYPKN